jgi:hypothetical protein
LSETFEKFCDASKRELGRLASTGIPWLLGTAQRATASWHPNGFVVFDLGPHPLGALRLHIWPTGVRQLRGDAAHVHTHVWDLCARVLSGVYCEQLYEFVGEDAGDGYQSAEIDYEHDRNTLEESGIVFLRPTEVVTANTGEVHTVKVGIPHETLIQDDSYSATLVVISSPRVGRASIYSRRQLPSSHYTRPTVSDALREGLLAELVKRIEDVR